MKETFIAILIFLGGFYARQLFDNRDLRRKILKPAFDRFEKHVVYIQTEWRDILIKQANDGNTREYVDSLNHGKDILIKSKTHMVFACRKINEESLIPLVEEAFGILMEAMSGYRQFLDLRNNVSVEQRAGLIKTLNDVNEKFDKALPAAMGKVYHRYWELISSTLIWETLTAHYQSIIKKQP
jgi:hypothetical protein